jgi:thiol-disulfide isomerase/thioredoxin
MNTKTLILMGFASLWLGCDAGDSDTTTEADNSAPDGGTDDDGTDDDDDGFTNIEEAEAGTNPDYVYSHPYTGGYNVGFCDTPPEPTGPTGTGRNEAGVTWAAYDVGDVVENWTMTDQYGELVDLYSFCGKHIVVAFSAGWCPPCRAAAEEMQNLQDEYRDQDVQFIEVLTGDNADELPSIDFLMGWDEQYGFTDIPVLLPPRATGWDAITMQWEMDMAIPTLYHISPNGTVLSADDLIHDPGQFLD